MSSDDQKKKKTDSSDAGATTTERIVLTVVLKIIDIHCEGCATKVKKSIRASEGVESVRGGSSRLTVIGDVDPEKLREMVEEKAKAKVELVSSEATRVEVKVDDAAVAVVKAKKKSGEKQPEKKPEKKAEEDKKKPKEASATTVVMKVDLHCEGCVQKIRKTVSKTKGYQEMSIDEKNNTVTVKGTMDMKALSELLKNQLHKPVEIVPPKKEEKPKEESKKEAMTPMEENRIQYGLVYPHPPPPPPPPMYGHEFVHPAAQYHYPQMFSDENPNACYIM